MIKEIAEDLLSIDEKTWARYAYSREPLRGKIAFDRYYNDYFQGAKKDGELLANQYRNRSIDQLLEDLGLQVTMLPMQEGQTIYNFAIYNEPDTIQIYKENAEESQMVVDSLKDERITVNIKNMLLAHEIFHALQNKHPELFVNEPHIHLWKLFGYDNNSRLVSLEEVAAMFFAKSYLGMKANPYVYDVIMCMSRAPERAKTLYRTIMQLKEKQDE